VTLRRLPDSPIGHAGAGILGGAKSEVTKVSRAPSPLKVEAGLWPGKIQQDHVGALLHALKDNFTTVWGEVEVANVEIGREVS
jgi:hypothetical protein